MNYIEAPKIWNREGTGIFLAGGITGCPDWQSDIAAMFNPLNVTLLNPRRKDFPIHDPTAAEVQIRWEHKHLDDATAILFWFPSETLCPIVLYELGAWSKTQKMIFVGMEPSYLRRQDVEIQTKLARPDVGIVYSLKELAMQVAEFVVGWSGR